MSDKSNYYLVIGPIEKDFHGYLATDRKEWLEDEGWQDVRIVWADPSQSIDYQLGYEAGRKAEREAIDSESQVLIRCSVCGGSFFSTSVVTRPCPQCR